MVERETTTWHRDLTSRDHVARRHIPWHQDPTPFPWHFVWRQVTWCPVTLDARIWHPDVVARDVASQCHDGVSRDNMTSRHLTSISSLNSAGKYINRILFTHRSAILIFSNEIEKIGPIMRCLHYGTLVIEVSSNAFFFRVLSRHL